MMAVIHLNKEIKRQNTHTHRRKKRQNKLKKNFFRDFLVVQRVRLRAPNAGGPDSIPGQGTRSHMHATTKSLHTPTKKATCHNEDHTCRN